MVNVREDLTGKIFTRLTVLKQTEDYIGPDGRRKARWLCECSCEEHNKVVVTGHDLKSGDTKSCGCLRKEAGKYFKKINKSDLSCVFATMDCVTSSLRGCVDSLVGEIGDEFVLSNAYAVCSSDINAAIANVDAKSAVDFTTNVTTIG